MAVGKTFPEFYNPEKALDQTYVANLQAAFDAGAADRLRYWPSLRPRSKGGNLGVAIDMQNDFAEGGSLPVMGARADVNKTIESWLGNLERLDAMLLTMDMHPPICIHFPNWWVNAQGEHPAPMTELKQADVAAGIWRPVAEVAWSLEYSREVGDFWLWTSHCTIGSIGSALVPALQEAVYYLAAARNIQPTYMLKGTVAKTEHFGPWKPVKEVPNDPNASLNKTMLDFMARYDIWIYGEAEDFCVREGMRQVIEYFHDQPDVLGRVHFTDATSLVFPDNRAEANEIVAGFVAQGVQLAKSIDQWA